MQKDGSFVTLENNELMVRVERHGAQLVSIFDKGAKREILYEGDPAVWGHHSPILFPFIGKSFNGEYHYEGKTYGITPHGFGRDMDFQLVSCYKEECWYKLADTPETMEKYPFHFEVEIGHRLNGREVEIIWRVTNKDSKEMLFMMGGHPAIWVPEGKNIYDYTLAFNKTGCNEGKFQDKLHFLAPDENGFEKDELQGELELENGCVPITKGFFDRALTYMFDDAQVSSVGLLVNDEPYVTLCCDGFPYLSVWTMEKTNPFVCLEPWYGICDKIGFKGELQDRRGVNRLSSGESWERNYSIRVD